MRIPDYIISHTIAEEHHQRQVQNIPNTDLPEPRPRNGNANDRFTTVRRQIRATLYTLARRMEPQPACSR